MAVVTVAFSDLSDWLDNQPDNTADTPYELNITGLTVSDIRSSDDEGSLGQTIKKEPNKYVDLSYTELPDGLTAMNFTFRNCSSLVNSPIIPDSVTDMQVAFANCTSLVNAPAIPLGVTIMQSTFEGCSSLINAPVIPDSVTNMTTAFANCTSLVNAPVIPDGVTNMNYTFTGCSSLVNAPIIPNSVTSMNVTFRDCALLSYKPIIPSTVTTSTNCYSQVTTNNWKGTQSQAESFLSTFLAQTTDSELQIYNDDRVTLEDTIHNVDISTLSTYLAGLDPNTVSTAYKVYIRGLTSLNMAQIRMSLQANSTKYVDLGYTSLPNGVTSLDYTFNSCTSLVNAPVIPDGVTSMTGTFAICTSLVTAPIIPNSVTNMTNTFRNCHSLVNAPVIPDGVTDMALTFGNCTSLVNAPVIPDGVTDIHQTFYRCSSLVNAPEIPEGVTNIQETFYDCSKIQEVPSIPSTITNGKSAFQGCTSLRKIDEFGIPLNTLKNNPDFQNMFYGCTALEEIGHKVEYSDDWHLVYLDFDTNTVQGKIYSRDKSSISIPQTVITKNTISLPLITDELMFSNLISIADLEDIIEGTAQQQGMLDTNYSWYGKLVIPPTGDNFIMYAKDPNKFSSNINFGGGGGGVDVEVVSATKSIMPTQDKREIINTASITLTLDYGATNGVIVEAYAMEDCSITFYKGASITETLSMLAGTRATFIYFNGWKYNGAYGAVWN